jgi:ABC-type lipoprotein export system ATPase subunit
MNTSFIQCENLTKQYAVGDLEVLALQGLNLSVAEGEMIGIAGASGSGKTTLMNVMGGLMRPTSGKVVVNGHDLAQLSSKNLDRYRREEVGFIWQHGARNLIPYLTARENVIYPMTLAGRRKKQREERAEQLLDLVGLSGRMGHKMAMLSGGEQQRVAIAIALANEPAILLGDEPTGELDTNTAQQIYDLLRLLNKDLGLTILLVSHDPNIAHQVDRVVGIRDGQLATEHRRKDKTVEAFTVVDANGRLQIPPNLREDYGIGDRVILEKREGGVLVRAVKQDS